MKSSSYLFDLGAKSIAHTIFWPSQLDCAIIIPASLAILSNILFFMQPTVRDTKDLTRLVQVARKKFQNCLFESLLVKIRVPNITDNKPNSTSTLPARDSDKNYTKLQEIAIKLQKQRVIWI